MICLARRESSGYYDVCRSRAKRPASLVMAERLGLIRPVWKLEYGNARPAYICVRRDDLTGAMAWPVRLERGCVGSVLEWMGWR
jgi:hypothetical protein